MSRAERMRQILEEALAPSELEIQDESARHRHHAHARQLERDLRGPQKVGETHYRLHIVSRKFNDMPLLARHRLVNELLAAEFETGLHALTLTVKGEA